MITFTKNWNIDEEKKWFISIGTGESFFTKEKMTIREMLISFLSYYIQDDTQDIRLLNQALQGFFSAEDLICFFTKYFEMKMDECICSIIPFDEQYFIDDNLVDKISFPEFLQEKKRGVPREHCSRN